MIFHKQIGDGPVRVVVIPGWFGDHRAFEAMFDFLDVKRFSYAFIDIRGYGDSRDEAGDYTMAEIAIDTLALADRLGWRSFTWSGTRWAARPRRRWRWTAASA